jgi:hypothetical protein
MPTAQQIDADNYQLPNGGVLRRGGRVRVPAELIWLLPQEDVCRLGISLDEREYSSGSEVLVWDGRVDHTHVHI